jgi:hypothetical protein
MRVFFSFGFVPFLSCSLRVSCEMSNDWCFFVPNFYEFSPDGLSYSYALLSGAVSPFFHGHAQLWPFYLSSGVGLWSCSIELWMNEPSRVPE